ncbi:hypothetical protein [Sphingopyxis sp. 550A]
MSKAASVHRIWRETERIAKICPFIIALIVVANLWHDHQQGLPFDWLQVVAGAAMMLAVGAVYLFCRATFKFVLARMPSGEHHI